MVEEHEDGSAIVELGFPQFESSLGVNHEMRLLHAVEYIAKAIGVLADAKIKEGLK